MANTDAILWEIELLGGFCARRRSGEIARFRRRKDSELLAYLACFPQNPHSRDELMELLWPEVEPSAGRNRLRQTLASLRRVLEPEDVPSASVLKADRYTIRLDMAAVSVDVSAFRAALEAAGTAASESALESLLTAIGIYREGFLCGFYQDWIVAERQKLQEEYLGALRRLARLLEESGKGEHAIPYLRRALDVDPLHEETHFALMRLYAAQGDVAAVRGQYQEMERVLREEWEESPPPAARSLLSSLLSQAAVASLKNASSSAFSTAAQTGEAISTAGFSEDDAPGAGTPAENGGEVSRQAAREPKRTEEQKDDRLLPSTIPRSNPLSLLHRSGVLSRRKWAALFGLVALVGLLTYTFRDHRHGGSSPPAQDPVPAARRVGLGLLARYSSRIYFSCYNGILYAMSPDGTVLVPLTDDKTQDRDPVPSLDGRRIAFQRNRGIVADICTMNADGTGERRLTHDDYPNAGATWSPDGARIAFYSRRDGLAEIFVMDSADGSNVKRLTYGLEKQEESWRPTWSPDGRKIAFSRTVGSLTRLFTMNTDGSFQVPFTRKTASMTTAAWSADGRRIAFSFSEPHQKADIFMVRPDGSNLTCVTHHSPDVNSPEATGGITWSPDGAQLAFASDCSGPAQIFAINIDGTGLKQLTTLPSVCERPVWAATSPDSTR
jgi:DNA-binding SARP family transcriptional activator